MSYLNTAADRVVVTQRNLAGGRMNIAFLGKMLRIRNTAVGIYPPWLWYFVIKLRSQTPAFVDVIGIAPRTDETRPHRTDSYAKFLLEAGAATNAGPEPENQNLKRIFIRNY
ncbi:hypothetical protein [Symmachiella macrocystis]|uniref:hypothetical protein n=1 Tax=Symmachiella macrocystis TaxID=2527985 RepID=UPI0011B7DEA6|nr:hypothetical protein [Symmachiella macrocystis]